MFHRKGRDCSVHFMGGTTTDAESLSSPGPYSRLGSADSPVQGKGCRFRQDTLLKIHTLQYPE